MSLNKFTKTIIKRILKREPNKQGNFKSGRICEGKTSKLSHVRAKVCDPRLSWIMFHIVCDMYRAAFKIKNDKVTELTNNQISELETRGSNLSKKDSHSEINISDALVQVSEINNKEKSKRE